MQTLKIIKIGGNVIDDDANLNSFLTDFAKIDSPKILVHGGGKLASQLSNKMGIKPNMINGRRITDADTLDITTMVYAGKINKNIIAKLQAKKCNSVGFSGADGNTIVSDKRPVEDIDFGFVGDVKTINTKVLDILLNNGITPVFCAISHNGNGQLLNTNADTIAAELAIGLSKIFSVELFYCFEKNGVLLDVNNDDTVVKNINSKNYQQLKTDGIIVAGMLPKIDNCFYAVNNGVNKVNIGNTTMPFNENITCTTIQL